MSTNYRNIVIILLIKYNFTNILVYGTAPNDFMLRI